MKDYVEFKLTGQAATDWSEASLTMLFDPKKRVWSDDLVANIGLDIERLPKIVPSTSVIGEITNTIAEKTNLMKGTPVVAGGIDDAISILGLNALETGVASNVSGTVENLDVCVDRIIPEKPEYLRSGIEFLCNVIPNSYIIHVGSFLSGGFLRWFRDQLGKVEVDRAKGLQVDPFVVMDKEAEEIPIGSDGLIAEPPASVYIVGEYSYDGSLQGLSTRHRRGHIIRAILEGIAFNLKEDLDIMKKLGVPVQKVVASGGCSRSTILNQIKSDILGVPIFLTEETEPGVLGAAILAGVGAGIYANPTIAAGKMVMEKENHFEPLHKAEYSKILNRRNRILAS
jgi:xylulokinase